MGQPDDKWKASVRQAFGERLRELRGDEPQDKFALRIGVHRTWVGNVERGERAPTLYGLAALAQGLDMDVADLLDGVVFPERP